MTEIIECTERPVPGKGKKLYLVLEEFISEYPVVYAIKDGNKTEYLVIKEEK